MKRVCTFFIILIALSCWTSVADAQAIRMPDEILAAVVRDELGLARGAPITRQAMQRLTFLNAQGYRIREVTGQWGQIEDITGLEHAGQLTRLWLNNNRIRDIRLLSRLTQLEELDIWNNQISDIGPLAGLKQLITLGIFDNPINDFGPLAGLVQLQRLRVSVQRINDLHRHVDLRQLESLQLSGSGNRIEDLRLLANLTQLRVLDVAYAQVRDLSFLERLTQLEWLGLGRNEISDLKPLANLTQLEWLGLDRNEISDLKPLANLTQLRWLNLGRNQISDLRPLAGLTQLRTLYLWINQIRDVTPLAGLVKLEILQLKDNPIQDASPLAALTRLRDVDIEIPEPRPGVTTAPAATGNVVMPDAKLAAAVRKALGLGSNAAISKQRIQGLTRLDARDSQITNLTGLEHATQLTYLLLYNNQISDVSPLRGLTQLRDLGLDDNQISNIRPLSGLKQLKLLHIGGNKINNSGVQLLSNLTELKWLSLQGNQISNITPLAKLTKLEGLWIRGNKIRDVSPLAGLVNLETLHLDGNPIQDISVLASLTKLRDVDIDIHQQSVPATGTWLAVEQPAGLSPENLAIKPGAFAIFVHNNQRSVSQQADFNTYRLRSVLGDADFPNLADFFQNGGRIELVSHSSLNPLPPNTREPQFADVVISEIMWGLDSSDPGKQYIELYNASAHTYTFTNGDLMFRFSKASEEPLPSEIFAPPFNTNARVNGLLIKSATRHGKYLGRAAIFPRIDH